MKVYAAMYNGMIHESSFGVLSIHKTRRGAEMAIAFHRAEKSAEHRKMYEGDEEPYPYDEFMAWVVEEMEVLE